MIAQELEVSLHMAFVEARQARHEFITVEHLLLALLDNPSAAEVLRACAVNIEDLRKTLTNFIGDNTPTVPGTGEVDTQPTLGFQRVIQRAIMHVQSASNGKKEVTGANVLVAIFGEKDSHAVYYLHQQGVTRLDVVNFISHGVRKDQQSDAAKASEGVAVRLLLDSVGSLTTRWGFVRALRNAGGKVGSFGPVLVLPLRRKWSANLRNHRKMVIIDGNLRFPFTSPSTSA